MAQKKLVADKITIAITTYKRVDYFEEALNCAVNQTVECPILVIDDHSPHNQFEEIVRQKNNPNITYIQNPSNIGMVETWNRCIDLCQTEYLTILHDDDLLHPCFIAHCYEVLQKINNPDCCIVVSSIIENAPGDFLETKPSTGYQLQKFKTKYFLLSGISPFNGVVFPVTVAKKIHGFNEKFHPSSDFDFWIRLSRQIDIYKSSYVYAFYRQSIHQESSTVYAVILNQTYEIRKNMYPSLNCFLFFSFAWGIYGSYRYYMKTYQVNFNPDEVITDRKLRRWVTLLYKTDKGIMHYFYTFLHKVYCFLILKI
ncbi:hypothetical protein FACS1894182_07820 [Bacteroidia bacterium]|nr:hypothetical protein FACS1894182_07820 [Bacteroidia bacterium]